MKVLIISTIFFSLIFGCFSQLKSQSKSIEWEIFNSSNSGLPSNCVTSIAIDSFGNKWIATYGGLVKYDDSTWTIWNTINSDLPTDFLHKVVIDKDDNKWIGTDQNGLIKFDNINWTVFDTTNSDIPHNYITSIAIDTLKNKWIGSAGGGLAKFDDSLWTIFDESNSLLPTNYIWAIDFDKYGIKLIGTISGLTKFDDTNWEVLHFQGACSEFCDEVTSLETDSNNFIWYGTRTSGLIKFDGINWSRFHIVNSQIPSNTISSINFDNNGILWLGTSNLYNGGGIAKFDGINWTTWNTSNSELPDNNVTEIKIDKFGNKWICTCNGGLAVFQDGGIITQCNKLISNSKVVIFPNPSNGFMFVSSSHNIKSIEVFNFLGEKLNYIISYSKQMIIDFSKAPKGIYFVKVDNGEQVHIEKVVLN